MTWPPEFGDAIDFALVSTPSVLGAPRIGLRSVLSFLAALLPKSYFSFFFSFLRS